MGHWALPASAGHIHPLVAVGVGVFLGHDAVAAAGCDQADPSLPVDALGVQVDGGVDEWVGHGRAVPVALDEDRAVRPGLLAEVVCAVAIDGLTQFGLPLSAGALTGLIGRQFDGLDRRNESAGQRTTP
jgi:hypothetical protein